MRQAVLESLGWRIHRIWCLDWRFKRKQELKRLQEAIERAIQESEKVQSSASSVCPPTSSISFEPKPVDFSPSTQQEVPLMTEVKASKIEALKTSGVIASSGTPIRVLSPLIPYSVADLETVTDQTNLIYTDEAISLIEQRILSLVAVEAPISIKAIVRPVAGCWGFNKTTKKLMNSDYHSSKETGGKRAIVATSRFYLVFERAMGKLEVYQTTH